MILVLDLDCLSEHSITLIGLLLLIDLKLKYSILSNNRSIASLVDLNVTKNKLLDNPKHSILSNNIALSASRIGSNAQCKSIFKYQPKIELTNKYWSTKKST